MTIKFQKKVWSLNLDYSNFSGKSNSAIFYFTRIPFYHFDVYRIGDVSEMDEIGYEDYFYGDGICFIEWANLIEEILPEHYTEIVIEKNLEKGFDYRLITMTKK